MTAADFTGTLAKIERAEEHLGVLETKIRAYIESEPIALDSKPNPDGSSEDFYFRFVRPIPDDLGLILGDCVHNLRSALDHIAMSLAINNGVDPYDSSVYFPICGSPESFFGKDHIGSFEGNAPRGTGRFKVCKLSLDAQTFVEEMQPYDGRHEAWPLSELQNLDNWDKHRAILPHAFKQLFQFESTHPGVTVEYAKATRIEDGAHLATVHYAADYSGVKMKPPLVAGISVERSNRIGFLVIPDFIQGKLFDQIRGIWSEAERRFGTWSERD
jgi:hypothetical protein